MKIEMHAHTSEVSPCGHVDARTMVKAYAGIGYDALVVTDHFNESILQDFRGTSKDKINSYLRGYRIAKEAGEEFGLKILLGVEVCLSDGLEDFLIYGIDEEFIQENPKMYHYTQEGLFSEVEKAGSLLYQAHPYRSYCHPRDPYLLHGVEVHNGNSLRHDNNNDKALAWANKYPHLRHSSGSDYHHIEDLCRGGIIIPDKVKVSSAVDLCGYMMYNKVELIVV